MVASSGFSVHEQVFTTLAMDAVAAALDRADLIRTRAGARHILSVPAIVDIAADDRLMALARQYVGLEAFAFRATLFDKSPGSNWLVSWHQDTALPLRHQVAAPGWGPWTVKGGVLHAIAPAQALERVVALRIHLDDSTADNGPLRVVPDSHTLGVLSNDEMQSLAALGTSRSCLVSKGGVVAMRPLTVHASSKAASDHPRRVIHIEYTATADFGDGIELAR